MRGRDWEAVGVGESCHLNSFVMRMVKAEYEESICTHPLLPVCQTSHLLKIEFKGHIKAHGIILLTSGGEKKLI